MGTKLPELGDGIGVGYRPAFREAFLGESPKPRVSWIEVITENFFPDAAVGETRARQTLALLRRDLPVAMHGVGLNLASADPLCERYLARLTELVARTEPWLVTDHLCWTGVNGRSTFDLLPFPFTREALAHVASRVQQVQDRLKRPLGIENITYYADPAGHELGEEEFLNELCARTGCRLLLDVNNIYVNSVNLGIDPLGYLRKLDLRHVAEIHLAGHSERRDGLLVDTHGTNVRDEVWALYEHALALAGPVPTMIERDQNIPAWPEMEKELTRLRGLRKGGAHAGSPGRVAEPLL